MFAGEKISPIEINVKPQIDISGIKVEGLENGKQGGIYWERLISVQCIEFDTAVRIC